ncbi:MAG TPA: N-acetyl-gamma-glutamyl-phosphate reductase [Candidatus Latescibacteria bacterium]|nr:N-acetyl-gamma-glutamyl-phosphate reductase [Candidatus Latescibacterota bacterium]
MRTAIWGATGYTGSELVRYLLRHPRAELALLVSESSAGAKFSDVFPGFRGVADLELAPPSELERVEVEVVFCCRAHTEAMEVVPRLLERGIRVVDLSADFRLHSGREYERWYGVRHTAEELLREAVYGLPELYRGQIQGARLVANPGCYPTAAALSIAPLLEEGLADPEGIVIDAKSGVSGAGRKLSLRTHFVEVYGDISPYNPGRTHRHTGEMEQELSKLAGRPVRVTFVPHLMPIDRGILSVAYMRLAEDVSTEELLGIYEKRYAREPFVRVVEGLPHTKNVWGTNFCDVSVRRVEGTDRAVAFAAMDNLGKGASGQAVQNMNLMFGMEETLGLR